MNTTARSFVREGYQVLTPHLTVAPAAEAIAFYERAFGARELNRVPGPGGAVLNALLELDGAFLMLNDPSPQLPQLAAPSAEGGASVVLHLYTRDTDALVERARRAGAQVLAPPADMFWGDRYALVRDPFGHAWGIATRVEDPTPQQMAERMAALGMG